MQGDILQNLLEPAILFFFLGLIGGAVRSNLEIPAQFTKFLSLYLLMAIGFKGGQALASGGLGVEGVLLVVVGMLLALLIPGWSFLILRRKISAFDAAAIAATYGSVSAITFIAASEFVVGRGLEVSGAMTVVLVLMETPAIIVARMLTAWLRAGGKSWDRYPEQAAVPPLETTTDADRVSLRAIVRAALTDGAHLLLIGSLVIGAVSGASGGEAMKPFVGDLFKGILAFFLLELGLLVSRQLRDSRDFTPFLAGFALVMPPINATVAILLARLIGASEGNAIILAVLAASASYIVVPAVARYAIPEARPSRYFTMALGITFPFNIVLGIPLYASIVAWIWR